MEKKLNEGTENKVENIWPIIFDAILMFASLIAFASAMITGEIILSVGGFAILAYVKTREIERKVSKIEKKICGEEDEQRS